MPLIWSREMARRLAVGAHIRATAPQRCFATHAKIDFDPLELHPTIRKGATVIPTKEKQATRTRWTCRIIVPSQLPKWSGVSSWRGKRLDE